MMGVYNDPQSWLVNGMVYGIGSTTLQETGYRCYPVVNGGTSEGRWVFP